jgi:hypothetical protein
MRDMEEKMMVVKYARALSAQDRDSNNSCEQEGLCLRTLKSSTRCLDTF